MFKNVASQKLTVLAFADAGHATLDAGEPVTGDAANITCKIEQDDDGTQSASNDTNPTEVEDGQYRFDLTQAETNGDKLTFYPESSTAGVQVVALPSNVIYTRPPNFADIGIETDGHVHADLKEWLGTAPLALASQRVRSHLGATDTAAIDGSAFAANTFSSGLFAANTIGASELAADAVQEIRDAILDRSLPGNHDTAGTPGSLLQAIGEETSTPATGDPGASDSVMALAKQLVNILVGSTGVSTFPAEAAPADNVSLAEILRAIHADVTGLNGDAMRGTDSAALASSLPTNFSSLAIDGNGNVDSNLRQIAGSTPEVLNLLASAGAIVRDTVGSGYSETNTTFQGGGTATLDATDDHYNGRIVIFTSGGMSNAAREILSFDGANSIFTVSAMDPIPFDGDAFIVV